MDMDTEKVLCAAIWINDGQKYGFQPTNLKLRLIA